MMNERTEERVKDVRTLTICQQTISFSGGVHLKLARTQALDGNRSEVVSELTHSAALVLQSGGRGPGGRTHQRARGSLAFLHGKVGQGLREDGLPCALQGCHTLKLGPLEQRGRGWGGSRRPP